MVILGQFTRWDCGLAGGVLSLFALIIEWPRPARERGRVEQRPFQEPFTKFVSLLGGFGKSYYVRFILYICICLPSCVCLPTLIPAICFFLAAITYLTAAIRGEHWRPIVTTVARRKTQFAEIQMPTRPPPRITGDTNASVLSRPSLLSKRSFMSNKFSLSSHKKSVLSNKQSLMSNKKSAVSYNESVISNRPTPLSNKQSIQSNKRSILANRSAVLSIT